MKRILLSSLVCGAALLSNNASAQKTAPAANANQQVDANTYFAQQTGPIFDCATKNAPKGWSSIALQLAKKDKGFLLFSTALMKNNSTRQFETCDLNGVAQNMYNLDAILPADRKNWKVLVLQLSPNRNVSFNALTQEEVARINSGKK